MRLIASQLLPFIVFENGYCFPSRLIIAIFALDWRGSDQYSDVNQAILSASLDIRSSSLRSVMQTLSTLLRTSSSHVSPLHSVSCPSGEMVERGWLIILFSLFCSLLSCARSFHPTVYLTNYPNSSINSSHKIKPDTSLPFPVSIHFLCSIFLQHLPGPFSEWWSRYSKHHRSILPSPGHVGVSSPATLTQFRITIPWNRTNSTLIFYVNISF